MKASWNAFWPPPDAVPGRGRGASSACASGWARLPVFAFLLFLGGCAEPPRLPLLGPDAVVLAFGDSLTYGTGAAPGQGYPEQLARRTGLKVINAGRPGELSGAGVERLPTLLERHRPALVLICHGGNDLLRLKNGKTLQENLLRMVKLAQASGAAVALIGVPKPGLLLSVPTLYREVAEQAGVPLEAEALAELEGEDTLKADAVHLNGTGYEVLAAAVETLLRESGALPE